MQVTFGEKDSGMPAAPVQREVRRPKRDREPMANLDWIAVNRYIEIGCLATEQQVADETAANVGLDARAAKEAVQGGDYGPESSGEAKPAGGDRRALVHRRDA